MHKAIQDNPFRRKVFVPNVPGVIAGNELLVRYYPGKVKPADFVDMEADFRKAFSSEADAC